MPGVLLQGVDCFSIYSSGHCSGVVGIIDGKCDAVLADLCGFPGAITPSVGTAVEGVVAVVALSVVSLSIDLEGCISNAVRVATRNSTVVGMVWVVLWGPKSA